tara:strand:- start:35731 stop:36393 length:663 start_codon:yes stop_codon:yes gene_type:complete
MSRPDATASAALDGDIIRPVFFVYLDIVGDPVRFTTVGYDVTMSGTGFAEMDGHDFLGISGKFIDISPVRVRRGGSDPVTGSLSGLRAIDNDTLNTIGDPANWQGRTAMLWRLIRNEAGSQRGAIQHYYTGYMTSLSIGGDPGQQVIDISIESYLAAFGQASNRTYLDQDLFDPGDLSARASIAIANGVSGNPLTNNTPTGLAAAAAAVNRSSGIADRLR